MVNETLEEILATLPDGSVQMRLQLKLNEEQKCPKVVTKFFYDSLFNNMDIVFSRAEELTNSDEYVNLLLVNSVSERIISVLSDNFNVWDSEYSTELLTSLKSPLVLPSFPQIFLKSESEGNIRLTMISIPRKYKVISKKKTSIADKLEGYEDHWESVKEQYGEPLLSENDQDSIISDLIKESHKVWKIALGDKSLVSYKFNHGKSKKNSVDTIPEFGNGKIFGKDYAKKLEEIILTKVNPILKIRIEEKSNEMDN